MRILEALLFAAFIGLIGVGIWNTRQFLPRGILAFANAPFSTPADTRAELEKPADKAMPARAKRSRSDPFANPRGANDTAAMTEVDVPVTVSLPTPKSLPLGSTSEQIRAKYGEPDLRVTEVRGGRICEYYYYYNRDRTQFTVATLESGILVSSKGTSP
jgi:hypothetical protein